MHSNNKKTTDWNIDTLFTKEFFAPHLIDTAKNIFEYTQFLLDDDQNLTKMGNLNKMAKENLHHRVNELLDLHAKSGDVS